MNNSYRLLSSRCHFFCMVIMSQTQGISQSTDLNAAYTGWLMAGMTTIYTSGSSTIFRGFSKATVIIYIINTPILATAIRLKIIYYFNFMNSGL